MNIKADPMKDRKNYYSELVEARRKLDNSNKEIERLTIKLNKFRKVTKLMENQV